MRSLTSIEILMFHLTFVRSRLWEVLPKHHPIAWDNRGLQGVCGALWRDCASYLERTGDKTVKAVGRPDRWRFCL